MSIPQFRCYFPLTSVYLHCQHPDPTHNSSSASSAGTSSSRLSVITLHTEPI